MSQRLQVSEAWLSRYLELARLPVEIVRAFGSLNVIGISHAASIAPLTRIDRTREALLTEAVILLNEQQNRQASQQAILPPSVVVQRLVKAGRADAVRGRRVSKPTDYTVRARDGAVIARGMKKGRGGGITIFLPAAKQSDAEQQLEACKQILANMST